LSAETSASGRTAPAAAWRDAAEAGLRYYLRLGGLALELAEAVVPAIAELRPTGRPTPALPAAADATPRDPPAEPPRSTIVVEAASGRSGLGVFMVENTTAQKVSAPVGVSAFVDADGREIRPAVAFSPDVVSLEPGDQVLVQVAAAVDDTLEPGVRYTGVISIPSLSEAGIPIVVRRRAGTARAAAKKPPPARTKPKRPRS
jgi:hypothetical protein